MSTEKIIIKSSIPISDALIRVRQVVDGGFVSIGTYGDQYCFMTVWDCGVKVFADKTKNGTHVFNVWSDK